MRRRPPYFGRQAVAEITKRFNGGGEQQRLAQRHHLRPEALLPGLRQEGLRVRRDHYAGDDLDALLLEGGDLRREIVVHVLEAARIEQRETFLRQRSRESPFLVAPGVAVTVVREQAADFLVGRHRLPAREEIGNHVLESPEEVIGPVEPRGRIAFAAEEPRLPRRHGGNAGDFVQLAGIRYRIGGLRRRRHQHQVDLVFQYEVVRDFAGTVRAGLAVLLDDLHRDLFAAEIDAAGEQLVHLLDDEFVRLPEWRERAGLRRHEAQFDGFRLREHGRR